ncbi:hypothetical protein [Elioraea rosea]|uniref:hypothetical protein n=1 Tax=Elioraea rosea TaxID=2492390 RepID=UPI001185099B|nr:hypothetical protein [Elioraea rosea]
MLIRTFLAAALAVATTLGASTSAMGTVFFKFTITESVPVGAVSASGWLAMSDHAFESGVNFAYNEDSATVNWNDEGIEALYFTAGNGFSFISATLQDLDPYVDIFDNDRWNFQLQSSGNGLPTGGLFFSDQNRAFSFVLDSIRSSGTFGVDSPQPDGLCQRTGACPFSGIFERAELVSISEPPPLLILVSAFFLLIISAFSTFVSVRAVK